MNEQIEKFDPSTLMQGVKDRIKATFVSLIPDDKWDEMVLKEVDAFFNLSTDVSISTEQVKDKPTDYWSPTIPFRTTKVRVSPFRHIVWQFCYEKLIATLKKTIEDEYFSNTWVNNKPEIKDKMKEVIAEAAPQALVNLFQSISLQNIEMLRTQINNYR